MRIFQVDAFASERFKGNPAGVCLMDADGIDEAFMQNVAMEMNLSETAFVARSGDDWQIRWFTPKREVSLCGHATLASAHILWETRMVSPDRRIVFISKSGALGARNLGGKIELSFPTIRLEPCPDDDLVNRAFGIKPVFTAGNGRRYLLEISDPDQLLSLAPDFALLNQSDRTGFIVTCPSNDRRFDFFSRFFAPGIGIPEDPVTGSAHCSLAPHWADRLGKKSIIGFQASWRTGVVECEVIEPGSVLLRGKAVTVFSGDLH